MDVTESAAHLVATDAAAIVIAARRRGLQLDRQLAVSEWADTHRRLPAANAEPGRWRTARTPYLASIMDSLSSSSAVERVVFMKSAQIGGTEAGLNWIGYCIHHAPANIMLVMPTIDMIRKNTRTRIDPMISDTPVLRELVPEAKSREPGNTIASKEFPGGQLLMVGANAPTGLRSTPCRYLFCDEIDAFPVDADGEGDPIALAVQRTVTYGGRKKIFLVSTPTVKGASRIETAYQESDQRRYFVPCPHCGDRFVMAWAHIQWPAGEPDRAFSSCPANGCIIEEREKLGMIAAGEWRPTAPGDGRSHGYHLNSLVSPFVRWADVARDFLASKRDATRLKSWTNLYLGETWEDAASAPVLADVLAERSEAALDRLPAGALVLTAGVDTQNDRLEVEVVAWGIAEESWSVAYEVLHGDPADAGVWQALDRMLSRRWPSDRTGAGLGIAATAIDSGGGRTSETMRFAAARAGRRVWAVKGKGGDGVPAWPKRPPKISAGANTPIYIVGVDSLKSQLYSRLRLEDEGPGYCHMPGGRDADWFAGLVSERPIKKWHKGVAKIEWQPARSIRNEPLDCRIYATSALHGLYSQGFRLENASNPAPKPSAVIKSQWMER